MNLYEVEIDVMISVEIEELESKIAPFQSDAGFLD